MAIDFSTPTELQLYDTGVLHSIRDNQFALACFLDGAGPINGNPGAGIKRYNASSRLFERWNGTGYDEMPLAYLKLAGGNLSGQVTAPDPTGPTSIATRNYVDNAIGTRAASAALAGYAALSGAAFSGNVSSTGAIGATGPLTTSSNLGVTGSAFIGQVVAQAALVAGDGTLAATGQFYMGAANPTTPISVFDVGDYITFDRGANQWRWVTGGNAPLQIDRGLVQLATISGNADNFAGNIRFVNGYTGGGPYWRVGPAADLDIVNSEFTAVNATFINGPGDLRVRGRLFANNGGDGIGAWHVQQGGAPAGGAIGDVWVIW